MTKRQRPDPLTFVEKETISQTTNNFGTFHERSTPKQDNKMDVLALATRQAYVSLGFTEEAALVIQDNQNEFVVDFPFMWHHTDVCRSHFIHYECSSISFVVGFTLDLHDGGCPSLFLGVWLFGQCLS